MSEKFDVIIVGAGPAGSAAAYSLAKMGFNILMIERGKYPGAKNVMGGRMYAYALNRLIPEFWKEAPIERKVTHEKLTLQGEKASFTLDFMDEELREPPNSYTILRGKFDQWFAGKAVEAGATLVSSIRVDDLIRENNRVTGIVAGTDRIQANVVIAADGAVSLLSEKAGLKKFDVLQFALGIKEIIELPEKTIEERFNLASGEGAAQLFVGHCTKGIQGGGFIYTNKTSLSVGIVVYINSLIEKKIESHELIREFNTNPAVAALIEGGKILEYSAHVIPEGGLKAMGKLYGDGILVAGDAAGFSMNIGVTVRGMEYAMASGYYAAQTVIQAKAKNDFTKAALSAYETLLNSSFVLTDFKNFQESLATLEYPPLFKHYPELALNIMKDLYSVPAGPKVRLFPTVKKYMSMSEIWSMVQLGRRMMKI